MGIKNYLCLKMKFAIAALIGATAAIRVQKDLPTRAPEFNEFHQKIASEETVGHNNRDVLENFAEMYVQQPAQGEFELLGIDGWRWNQAITVGPETNYSAWNTHTSAVTKKPTKAQDAPYPDHPATT